jgi:hypothetical protein
MKASAALVLLVGCKVIVPTSPSDQSIYQSLVDAGCMAATDAGPSDIAAERALPAPPAWLNCLVNGGTVAGCAVPCTSGVSP